MMWIHSLIRSRFSLRSGTFNVPSLLLTVSGTVAHHTPQSLSSKPPSNAPRSAANARGGKPRAADGFDPDAPIDSHPRVFSQNFVLVPAPQAEGGVHCAGGENKDGQALSAKFFVQADTFRFVG